MNKSQRGNEALFGVCGYPLAQSLSPVLHTWAMKMLRIQGSYDFWETSPEDLPNFITRFRAFPLAGASITIPHKETIMPFLDGISETAHRIGAVNTLHWQENRLFGHNTDLEGFISPLISSPLPEAALILGSGGAARAAMQGLADLNIPRIFLAARNRKKSEELAKFFAQAFAEIRVLEWERRAMPPSTPGSGLWVINTTPLGMYGKTEGESPLPAEFFVTTQNVGPRLAYDLVYNPLETVFLAQARSAAWECRDGLDMFVAQAAAQLRLWTGQAMPVPEAKAYLIKHLSNRHDDS